MFRLVARRCSRRPAHSPMTGCSIQYTPPRPNLSRGWATERIVSWADKGEERIVRQSCIVSLAGRTGVINTSLIAAVTHDDVRCRSTQRRCFRSARRSSPPAESPTANRISTPIFGRKLRAAVDRGRRRPNRVYSVVGI